MSATAQRSPPTRGAAPSAKWDSRPTFPAWACISSGLGVKKKKKTSLRSGDPQTCSTQGCGPPIYSCCCLWPRGANELTRTLLTDGASFGVLSTGEPPSALRAVPVRRRSQDARVCPTSHAHTRTPGREGRCLASASWRWQREGAQGQSIRAVRRPGINAAWGQIPAVSAGLSLVRCQKASSEARWP